MLNADEARNATNALEYGKAGTPEGIAYRQSVNSIKEAFLDYLRDEYGSDYSPEIAEEIINRAWDYGHDSGYHQVEEAAKDHEEIYEAIQEED